MGQGGGKQLRGVYHFYCASVTVTVFGLLLAGLQCSAFFIFLVVRGSVGFLALCHSLSVTLILFSGQTLELHDGRHPTTFVRRHGRRQHGCATTYGAATPAVSRTGARPPKAVPSHQPPPPLPRWASPADAPAASPPAARCPPLHHERMCRPQHGANLWRLSRAPQANENSSSIWVTEGGRRLPI